MKRYVKAAAWIDSSDPIRSAVREAKDIVRKAKSLGCEPTSKYKEQEFCRTEDSTVYYQRIIFSYPDTDSEFGENQYYVEYYDYDSGKWRKKKITRNEAYKYEDAAKEYYTKSYVTPKLEKIAAFDPNEFRTMKQFEDWVKSVSDKDYEGYPILDESTEADLRKQVEAVLDEPGWVVVTVLDDGYVQSGSGRGKHSYIDKKGCTKGEACEHASWQNRELSPYIRHGYAWTFRAMSEAEADKFLKERNAEEDRLSAEAGEPTYYRI